MPVRKVALSHRLAETAEGKVELTSASPHGDPENGLGLSASDIQFEAVTGADVGNSLCGARMGGRVDSVNHRRGCGGDHAGGRQSRSKISDSLVPYENRRSATSIATCPRSISCRSAWLLPAVQQQDRPDPAGCRSMFLAELRRSRNSLHSAEQRKRDAATT